MLDTTLHNAKVETPYSKEFFDSLEDGSIQSAQVVVPLILNLMRPESVIDVGCGRGVWLREFRNAGVINIYGVDGSYVNIASLHIPKECFSAVDLSQPFELSGKYDLAMCIEVAEHLPSAMANILVQQLTAAAPLILFSAAIPGQGGAYHLNEQLPSYWRRLFEARNYIMFDPIRPTILTDSRIEYYYRQNMVVYASKEWIHRLPLLLPHRVPADAVGIEWVHYPLCLRQLCRFLPSALWCAIKRRLVSRRLGLSSH